MQVLFREHCEFCCKTKIISDLDEVDYYNEIEEETGLNIPMYPSTKQEAKNCFKELGWFYEKGIVLCKECFDLLKDGRFVVNKYNYFCTEDGNYNFPEEFLVMDETTATSLVKKYKGEKLRSVKALPTAVKFFRGEWKTDVVGLVTDNPNTKVIVSDFKEDTGFSIEIQKE